MMTPTTRISLLIFDEVEVLDACGPFEVFSVAGRIASADQAVPPPVEVTTLSAGPTTTVRARGGLRIIADRLLAEAPPTVDVAMVPGGITDGIERDPAVLAWIRRSAASASVVASVCTGAFAVADTGLLDDLTVTTHWEDRAELQRRFPRLRVVDDLRYVDHGHLATSAGVSAGIDLSLHLVARLFGPRHAAATARQMDYHWVDDPVVSPI